MTSNKKNNFSWIKYIIVIILIPLIALGFQLLVFADRYNFSNLITCLFASSAIIFFIGLILLTGATRIWSGISYSARLLFKRRETKEKYQSYGDYINDRASEERIGNAYIVIIAFGYLLIDFILAMIDIY